MKKSLFASAAIVALGGLFLEGSLAKGPGKPPPSTEAANNISFPLILSDNVGPAALPVDAPWRFASITNPQEQCIGEAGVTPGTVVNPAILCYYGRKVTVVAETGAIEFSGETKVWWLQKRGANFWKALTVGRDTSAPLVVSAVDVGDLLESSPQIATRQIRTEFNLLQNVAPGLELSQFLVPSFPVGSVPLPCLVPAAGGASTSIGCFAALAMSGAVPGTEQSGNEIQGTDFGPGVQPSPGSQTLLDPAQVRLTTPDVGGVEAVVYSRCARLIIQRISGVPTWNPDLGQWNSASAPIVNVAAYRNEYNSEVTSSGSLVYGYNWNAKTAATGTYRLTFVLDGNDTQGPQCSTKLATRFVRPSPSSIPGTTIVNVGENNPGVVVFFGESGLGDEGGLAYVDLTLTTKGGGGGGGGR